MNDRLDFKDIAQECECDTSTTEGEYHRFLIYEIEIESKSKLNNSRVTDDKRFHRSFNAYTGTLSNVTQNATR